VSHPWQAMRSPARVYGATSRSSKPARSKRYPDVDRRMPCP
jgi:hypothetical protein